MLRRFPVFILWCACAIAQGDDANALFQKQDWAGAARLYEAALKSNAEDGASWFRLGTCLHRLDRNQESRQAFHKALDLKFQPLAAMVVIARSYFKDGNPAEGTTWLTQAVDGGFANIAMIDTDADLSRAKAIPEVAKLRERVAVNANPCQSQPEYHQFDFWLGEWDVASAGAPGPAQSRIERLLDGCIIQENWMPPGYPGGKSWNFYNAATKKWEQVWVAPGGSFKLEGTFHDGAMHFEGRVPRPGAADRMDKLTFTPLEGPRVRQYWEQSLDGGKTWTVAFDGIYTPRKK